MSDRRPDYGLLLLIFHFLAPKISSDSHQTHLICGPHFGPTSQTPEQFAVNRLEYDQSPHNSILIASASGNQRQGLRPNHYTKNCLQLTPQAHSQS